MSTSDTGVLGRGGRTVVLEEVFVEDGLSGGGGGGGLTYTRVTFNAADFPGAADPSPGNNDGLGLVVYTPVAGELLLHEHCGISIAPGDEFDGDRGIYIAFDGFQGSEIGSCFPGDVDTGPDTGNGEFQPSPVYGNAGFWKMARNFGPYPAGDRGLGDFAISRSYFKDDTPLVAYSNSSDGNPATGGRITFVVVTIRPST
jgi:hypothetical protein